jgi:hypothetical protein
VDVPEPRRAGHGALLASSRHRLTHQPKRRTIKHNLQFLDINGQGEHNNGNIVVIPDDDAPSSKLDVDEVVINSRKYRVPEKTIRLDFWSKLGFGGR